MMTDDATAPQETPELPEATIEVSDDESEGVPYAELSLVVVGVLYPLIGFGVLLLGGGPLAFSPFEILLPAVLLIAAVFGLWTLGVRFSNGALVAFVAWVVLVVLSLFRVWAEAVANV